MTSEDEHSCTANLEPEAQGYDSENEIPVTSGTPSRDGFTAFMSCTVCGKKFDVQYEYEEAIPV